MVAATRARRRKTLADGSVPERVIQAQILDWLKDSGVLHWRANSGIAFTGHRRIFLGPDGMPDIVLLAPPNGKFVGLEVKSKNGSVRKDQVAFAKKISDVGGMYFIVRSLTDAKAATAQALGALS